jgi:hypothetical protein
MELLAEILETSYGKEAEISILDNEGPKPETELLGFTLETDSHLSVVKILANQGFRVWSALNQETFEKLYRARTRVERDQDHLFAKLRREGKISKKKKVE